MSTDPNDVQRITLEGDLSMVGVTEQLPLLARYLDRVAGDTPSVSPHHELDLTGLQALDACGCQLLATFLHCLRRCGAEILSLKLNTEYREKIRSLGFAGELLTRECA